VPNINNEKLEGITLSVYLYIVKKRKPVGPRDVMKGAHLSSPSVAYRHLQKLEDWNLLRKNEYGEYLIKNKAHMDGYFWIGRHVIPKMFTYSLIFLSIFVTEVVILAIHYPVESYKFVIFFSLLILVTGLAAAVFVIEGILQRRGIKRSIQDEK
jgi:hypothetical protein